MKAKKYMRRITLGSYSSRGLFTSFGEGAYDTIAEAFTYAECAANDLRFRKDYCQKEELGICVAAFSKFGGPARVIKRFLWRELLLCEWELDGVTHRTVDGGGVVVLRGMVGSMVAATDEYLIALRHEISEWLTTVEHEIDRRADEAARAEYDAGCERDDEP